MKASRQGEDLASDRSRSSRGSRQGGSSAHEVQTVQRYGGHCSGGGDSLTNIATVSLLISSPPRAHLISVARHGTAHASSHAVHPGVVAAVAHPGDGVGGAALPLGPPSLHVASPHSPGIGQNGLIKNVSLSLTEKLDSRTSYRCKTWHIHLMIGRQKFIIVFLSVF